MPAMLAKPRQNRGKRIYCALLLVCCSLWVCSATGEEGNGKPFTASAFGSKSPSSASNNNNGAAPSTLNTKNNHHSFALVGRMMPFLQTLLITPKEARYIWSILSDAISAGDLVALSILGWGTVPLVEFPYRFAGGAGQEEKASDRFRRTYMYQIATHVSQLAKIATLVYAFDCLTVILSAMGLRAKLLTDGTISQMFAKICYTVWGASRMKVFKRHLIRKALSIGPENKDMGKAVVFDHLANFVLGALTLLFILDDLSVRMGMALSSFLAFGGVGTLVVSLAAKDAATLVISGLMLSMSDKFHEGEVVKLGDGTNGVIVKMHWTDTTIRGSDNVWVKIPNNQLTGQRVYNLSRVHQCQIQQNLRFRYSDADKIPMVIENIKTELRRVCSPHLITDGSRPFRVTWTDYKDDHLSVALNLHFNIKPVGDAYWTNRQKVLEAVNKAVASNDIKFANLALPP